MKRLSQQIPTNSKIGERELKLPFFRGNMKKLYDWFKINNGKKMIILNAETLTPIIDININIRDLPHLVGLHYVYGKNIDDILGMLATNSKTIEDSINDYIKVEEKEISLNELRERIYGFCRFIDYLDNENQLFMKSDKGIMDKIHRKNLKFTLYPNLGQYTYLELFIAKKKNYYCESFLQKRKPTFSGNPIRVKVKIE